MDYGLNMKAVFKKAGNIFKYLVILFTIIFWIYVIWDDWIFIERYWKDHWADYIGLWTLWFLVYLIAFSFYYWVIVSTIIFIYYKKILRISRN